MKNPYEKQVTSDNILHYIYSEAIYVLGRNFTGFHSWFVN